MGRWGARAVFAAVLVMGAWASLTFKPPLWVYPAAFAVVFVFYANTFVERVPLYLTNRTTWAAIDQILTQAFAGREAPRVVDLGCGVGGLVGYLARVHPDWQVVGVETAPGPYLISKLRTRGLRNASVRFQSLWRTDLSPFDGAYAFLSPAPMPRLLDKVAREMQPGSVFISNSFWADDGPGFELAEVNDARASKLHIRRI